MKTVGQVLLSERKKKKWTLEDVHKFIKIHPKYLKALESGDYSVFSDKVHAKGFLKIYSQFLELDVEQMLAFWRREYAAEFDKTSRGIPEATEKNLRKINAPTLVLTPKNVLATVVSLLVVIFFGIMFYQYKAFSGDPTLSIYSPQDSVVVTAEVLDVSGKTERDVEVFVNNQQLTLNTDGSFSTSVKLNPGLNTLSFSATNSLGRSISTIRTVVFKPQETAQENDTAVLSADDNNESTESTDSLDLDSPN